MNRPTAANPASGSLGPPSFNALKHGLYVKSILLPGEDPGEFQRRRRAAFHQFLPQTEEEAELVDALAECRWLRRRYRPVQTQLDAQALHPVTDAAHRVCEPDTHRRLHSTMDVTVHRQRVDRRWHRTRAELMLAQKQRRQGLVPGARALPPGCYMEVDGQVFGPIAPAAIVPLPEPALEADKPAAPGCADTRIGFREERKESPADAAVARPLPAAIPEARGAALLPDRLVGSRDNQSASASSPLDAPPRFPGTGTAGPPGWVPCVVSSSWAGSALIGTP